MILILSPVEQTPPLTVYREGDVLVLNGVPLDFGPLPEGGVLPATAIGNPWIAGDVTRTGGVLTVPLILPHGPAAPQATRFPAPITLTGDGPVALPAHDSPQVEEASE